MSLLNLSRRGRPRQVDLREIVNAINYVLRTGCAWRLLPHDFPAWQTVYGYFRRWRDSQLWAKLNDLLVPQVRQQAGREAEPSAAIMDSQSVKTTAVAGERGFDGVKLVKGRKRHLLVDVLGLVLAVYVHPANVSEPADAKLLLRRAKAKGFCRLQLIWADGGLGHRRDGLVGDDCRTHCRYGWLPTLAPALGRRAYSGLVRALSSLE